MPRKYKILLRQGSGVPTAANWDAAEPAFDPTAGRLYVKGTSAMVEFSSASFINGQSTGGGSITLALSDVDRLITGDAGVVTVPLDSSVNFPIGSRIWIYNSNASAPINFGGTVTYRGSVLGGIPPRGLGLIFKIATNEWQISKFLADGMTATVGNLFATSAVTSPLYLISAITSISSATHTLASANNGAILAFTSNTAVTLTIPTSLSSTFSCSIIQQGTGQITFTPATGVTRNAFGGATKTAGQYAVATLIATAANTFILGGQVVT
jgi:hypothetical protein